MNKYKPALTKRYIVITAVASLAIFATLGYSNPPTKGETVSKSITNTTQSNSWKAITWNNGKRDITSWLNPEEYAEFYVPNNNAAEQLKSTTALRNANSQQVKTHGITTIWRAEPQQVENIVSKSLADSASAAANAKRSPNVSPVFHSSPRPNSPRMALPGNVIIRFQSDMAVENIHIWLTQHNLLKERSLPGDGLTIVVKSEPGMAALNLVKRLGKQTEIYEISPNWWSEPQRR
ncbi:MAG: hypothetical protein L3J98_02660 [Gammaproteobacteria bacterium]|nr:hypothetical protein [Gammaproteobacteria bacterium]MCF6259056.1 hypothetical protein [Gammaproteobacteria bacterium]